MGKQKIVSEEATKEDKKICGIVMPISSHPNYPLTHWADMKEIIEEAISQSGFTPRLVSDSEAVVLIQESIVNNIYDDEMIVCDVSSKNANVMLELGLRLAFDKPVVIIKDDETEYSFDTSGIEHLPYPKTLRYGDITEFKKKLSNKIIATYNQSQNDKDYSPFLKRFGSRITPKKIDIHEVSQVEYLTSAISELKVSIGSVKSIVDKFNYIGKVTDLHPDFNIKNEMTVDVAKNVRNSISYGESASTFSNKFTSKTKYSWGYISSVHSKLWNHMSGSSPNLIENYILNPSSIPQNIFEFSPN